MGKGLAKRRRAQNAIRAQDEKKNRLVLVQPDSGPGKGKRKRPDADVPSSLRKMLLLKSLAASGSKPRGQQQGQQQAGPKKQAWKEDQERRRAKQRQQQLGPAGEQQPAEGEQDDGPEDAERQVPAAPVVREPNKAEGRHQQGGEQLFGEERKLKSKRKEFLKSKDKKRRQGRHPGEELGEKEAELEERAAASKPAFGEQGHQPLKAQLKRRHWVDQERTAADRCGELFAKQMAEAEQAVRAGGGGKRREQEGRQGEAVRQTLIAAYRQHKVQKLEKAGVEVVGLGTTATPQSLAALVRKDAGKDAAFAPGD